MSLKYLCTTFIDSAYSYSKIKRLKSQLQRIEDSSQLLECWLALVFQLLPKITEVILIAHRIGSRSAHFNLISCSSFRILFCTFRGITCFVFTCDGHMLFPWLCLVVSWFSQVFFQFFSDCNTLELVRNDDFSWIHAVQLRSFYAALRIGPCLSTHSVLVYLVPDFGFLFRLPTIAQFSQCAVETSSFFSQITKPWIRGRPYPAQNCCLSSVPLLYPSRIQPFCRSVNRLVPIHTYTSDQVASS